jgi:hypothetical protein
VVACGKELTGKGTKNMDPYVSKPLKCHSKDLCGLLYINFISKEP